MKAKITTVCLSLLSAVGLAQSMEQQVMQAAIEKLKNAKAYTLKVALAMPEAQYGFKPSEEEMNFGQQLLHISSNLAWLSTDYFGGLQNPLTKEDKAQTEKKSIISVVEKTYDYAISALQNFNPAQLPDSVKFFAGPKNKFQMLTLINDHQTHHRAQLLVYLRLNGIKPPDYVGW